MIFVELRTRALLVAAGEDLFHGFGTGARRLVERPSSVTAVLYLVTVLNRIEMLVQSAVLFARRFLSP